MTSLLLLTMDLMASNQCFSTVISTTMIKMMTTSTILLSVVRTMMALSLPVHNGSSHQKTDNENNQAWKASDWTVDALFRGNHCRTPTGQQLGSDPLASLVEFDMGMISKSIDDLKIRIMNNTTESFTFKWYLDAEYHQV